MSRFFIFRPIFASVISIVIIIAGIVSFGALPVAKFPEVSPPTVQVKATYPGANAATIAETVATPIEQEVNGVEGMIYMSSTSASDGSYTLTVTFELGTDMDIAAVLVQNRVAIAEPKLPEDVRRQGITTKKQSTQILQFIALSSPDQTYDALFLSNYGLTIKDELSRVAGVGDVMVFGVGDYGMRVWLNPHLLKQRGLTTEDIVQAIREQNVQVAAGQIGAAPTPPGAEIEYTVNTQGRLVTVDQFKEIIVRTGEDGQVLRVGDVARVELGAKSYTFDSTFNGQPSASMAIYQLPGANALDTAKAVETRMADLAADRNWPEGMEYSIPFDTTLFVTASINEVYETLFVAALLVVIVIYLFLQDWRATIVPVVAIPVSLIGTFAIIAGLGFSINMLSLFGVVLAIGIVVDDAIVVVENSTRHVDNGMAPKQAAVKAMEEITGPVIATTLVLLAVFVPTAFMGGITGQLNRQFALTISAAVLISTLNALTLSPALCGLILRPAKEKKNFFFRGFNNVFDWGTRGYKSVIGRLVKVVTLVMVIYFGLVGLTGYSFEQLPTGFVPVEDQGYMFTNIQLPDGATLERTRDVLTDLESIYEETPGIANYINISGYSLLSGNAGSNMGFSVLMFEPWDDRKTPELSQGSILASLQQKFYGVTEAIVFGFIPPPIDGLGNAGGFQMEIQDRGNAGYAELQNVAESVVLAGTDQSGLAALNTTFRANVPQLFVEIDRTKAKTMGVPLSSIFGTLQAYLGSAYVNDFTYLNRSYQVRVQAEAEYRAFPSDISSLNVRDLTGQMVPLDSLVNVEDDFGPTTVRRYNLYPSASVNGSAAAGFSSGQGLQLMEQLAGKELPDSFGYEWTGMSYQEKLASGGQLAIFGLAVIFVFLVLAAQYESWTSPAAVIAVVPLAALGVVLALIVRGADNNTYTQIGIVLLVALASKNAILIVEFASEQRRLGLSIQEAAVKAAELRFRAILMTAFSSILGFLPLLVASGAGAASRQAVGNAIVGGMLAATIFSFLFVPTFFVLFRGLAEWRTPKNDSASVETDGNASPDSASPQSS
ncbi:Efflux pump membrane transporter BepE [Thalassoglobus neptunius]|uniref:Efflux pump membrane transporter BepE n=1 Tax=Thalassoglobus neptunius TaxID=1938619 RepID=A0A5C5WP58_9PLAN|nr:multidrug efflux RND transporter permease subunit [Thalassoglobus neptunius]TWT51881.1 Efflux pump membrane transporter BepE [Thalassoglobus neptunius]